jgi:hypothetical protein
LLKTSASTAAKASNTPPKVWPLINGVAVFKSSLIMGLGKHVSVVLERMVKL